MSEIRSEYSVVSIRFSIRILSVHSVWQQDSIRSHFGSSVLLHASQERERCQARQHSADPSPVIPVTCVSAMVGFTTEGNALHVRSLLEGLAQADEQGEVTGSKTRLRVHFRAKFLDETRHGKESERHVSCSYRDSTGYVHIQTTATLESMALKNLMALERCYLAALKGETVTDMEMPSLNMGRSTFRIPAFHTQLLQTELPESVETLYGLKGYVPDDGDNSEEWTVVSVPPMPRVSEDEELHAALEAIAAHTIDQLHAYPAHSDAVLTFLTKLGHRIPEPSASHH